MSPYFIMIFGLHSLAASVGIAANSFPSWMQCDSPKQCVAIQSTCSDWEYANIKFAKEREAENIQRRKTTPCTFIQDLMHEPPQGTCFAGVCTSAQAVQPKKERCSDFQQYLASAFVLSNTCEENADCARGLASCSTGCEFRPYNKSSRKILDEWQEHYSKLCGIPCHSECIDPLQYTTDHYHVKCVHNHCTYSKVRTDFQSDNLPTSSD